MTSKKSDLKAKLVFFGTGQTSLEALQCLSEDFEIELVVTKPPATNSAGKSFKNSVHTWAEENSLPVLTPANKQDLGETLSAKDLDSELGVVLDFGMIIPSSVIDLFPKGILNSHFSLLPKYRGADPIRATILNGDESTGVTIIKITPGLDEGPILTWAELDTNRSNAQELRERLSVLNCGLLPETIKLYLEGSLEPVLQDESEVSHTHKTSKEDGIIDPDKSPVVLANEVLAYTGWPKSTIKTPDKSFIVLTAKASDRSAAKGKLEVIDKELYYGCEGGSLHITKIQPQGKAPMDAAGFINGYLK
jgi:methionyl-tRNA formyltransferase